MNSNNSYVFGIKAYAKALKVDVIKSDIDIIRK